MRKLGKLKTETQVYKITMQEVGSRSLTDPRCPIIIYEKDTSGGWSHLETIDGEKESVDSSVEPVDMKDEGDAWSDAVEIIKFYDDSDIVVENKEFS